MIKRKNKETNDEIEQRLDEQERAAKASKPKPEPEPEPEPEREEAAEIPIADEELVKIDDQPLTEKEKEIMESIKDTDYSDLEEGSKDKETLKRRITKNITIKLGRFGNVVADSEQFVYFKTDINRVMNDEEVEAERKETKDDVDLLIQNRFKLVSEFGDVINVVIDFLSHIATRAFRIYGMKKQQQDEFFNSANQQGQSSGREEQLAKDLNISVEQVRKLLKGEML